MLPSGEHHGLNWSKKFPAADADLNSGAVDSDPEANHLSADHRATLHAFRKISSKSVRDLLICIAKCQFTP